LFKKKEEEERYLRTRHRQCMGKPEAETKVMQGDATQTKHFIISS
jgi:hypothetical protein